MNPVYSAAVAASLSAFSLARWQVEVRGAEHIPASGPAVVATNHVSYLDFVFVGFGARQQGRRVRFVAKREVFDHRLVGPLMRSMGHIRVDRGGDTRAALREAAQALRAGDVVGMFPEGTISPSFVPLEGRSGSARMALDSGAPLVPGAVWGSHRIHTKVSPLRLAPGTVVSVTFGEPVAPRPDDTAASLHARLMVRIRELVDTAQRRYPQRPAGPHEAWWQPAHLGGCAPSPEAAEAEVRAAADERRRIAVERRRAKLAERGTGTVVDVGTATHPGAGDHDGAP